MKKYIPVLSLLAVSCIAAILLASCGGGGDSSALAKQGGGDGDGSGDGVVAEGKLKWNFMAEGAVNSSPAVSCDGTIYFGADDGFLYACEFK